MERHLHLMRTREASEKAASAARLDAPERPVSVLLAVHAASARDRLRPALEREGLEVVAWAKDARQAIRDALHQQPDVCLLDVELPGGVTGAVAAIAAHLPRTRIGILAESPGNQRVVRAIRAGADGVLRASAPLEELLADAQLLARGELRLPPGVSAKDVEEAGDVQLLAEPRRSWTLAVVLYLPRFFRHLWRRLRSGMSLSVAWTSARDRMTDYW